MHPVPSPYIEKMLQMSYFFKASNNYINKISALNHEVLNDSVKCSSLKTCLQTISFEFSGAKLPEVFCCFWYNVSKQLNDNTADLLYK